MPTYACSAAIGLLSPSRKERIVQSITRIHHEEAKAPAYLVQVIFHDLPTGNHWIAGALAPTGQIWVRGDIRAGRTEEQKARMLERILADIAGIAETVPENVWVYICDIPASNIAEYGSILPTPGNEAAWLERLPAALKARLGSRG